jgi:hypothetical protein
MTRDGATTCHAADSLSPLRAFPPLLLGNLDLPFRALQQDIEKFTELVLLVRHVLRLTTVLDISVSYDFL